MKCTWKLDSAQARSDVVGGAPAGRQVPAGVRPQNCAAALPCVNPRAASAFCRLNQQAGADNQMLGLLGREPDSAKQIAGRQLCIYGKSVFE